MRTSDRLRERWEEDEKQEKLLSQLAEENVQLKHTIEKLQAKKQNPKGNGKQYTELKRELAAKDEECQHLQQQLNKLSVEIQVYSTVESQLDKLETLQNQLLSENQKLKEDHQKYMEALVKIKRLMGIMGLKSKEAYQITTIINDTIKNATMFWS